MASLCPSCNKFASLEMQDPEVNSIDFDSESMTVSAEVRIVRVSGCCNDEMKESTFNTDMELDDALDAKVNAIWEKDPEAEIEVEEESVNPLEEGGSRYKKSYYGYTLVVALKHGSDTIGTIELSDKIEASGMDELT